MLISFKKLWLKHLILILAYILTVLPIAVNAANAEDAVNHELPEEFRKYEREIRQPQKWNKVPVEYSNNFEVFLMEQMGKIIRKMQLDLDFRNRYAQTAHNPKEWLKTFLSGLYQKISDEVNQKNDKWYQEYMALMHEYNSAAMNRNQFYGLESNLLNSLNNFNELGVQSKSVKDVHLQHLQGVPTTFLIIR